MDELKRYDLTEIRRAIAVLFADVKFGAGECVEVRIPDKKKHLVAAGWFDDVELLAKHVAVMAKRGHGQPGTYRHVHENAYWTCNPVTDALLSRQPKNTIDFAADTSSDNNITRRLWLPIDIDPLRASGVSATAAERQLALAVANNTVAKLVELGFPASCFVGGNSGNGYHVLIRIDLPNNPESRDLLKKCLAALQGLVGTAKVEIDPKVYNAARIIKCYGTLSCKGINTEDRPWTWSKLTIVPEVVTVCPRELLEKLAALAPDKNPKRDLGQKRQGPWTVENTQAYLDWTPWEASEQKPGGQPNELAKWLGPCIVDDKHKDSAIILHTDGWWSYGCFHAGCSEANHKTFMAWAEEKNGAKYPYPGRAEPHDTTWVDQFADPKAKAAPMAHVAVDKKAAQAAWQLAAAELFEIRKGMETVEDAEGKPKAHKKFRHQIDDEVLTLCYKTLQGDMQGKLFVDAYPYLFLPMEGTISDLHDEESVYRILSRLGLRLTQLDYKLVEKNLHSEALFRGEKTHIEKFGCMRGDAIYVNNGRNGMIRITTDKFEEVPNGADGVYMLNKHLRPWPALDPARLERIAQELDTDGGKVTDSPLCNYLSALFEEGTLKGPQYQQLVMLRYLSLFLRPTIDLRPIMMAVGPQNSGKSTLWENIIWLFYGVQAVSGGLPTKLADFIAAITNHQIQIFDNIDRADFLSAKSEQTQYVDMLCKCSTSGKISIRQLYKNNVDKDYELRCDLFLTSRTNPFPSHYTDLLRRVIIFPIRRPTAEEYRTTESMKRELIAKEEDFKLETLVRLQLVLRALIANHGKDWTPISEMHSFETYTMKVACHEGWAKEMKAIWRGYYSDYQKQAAEDSPFVNFIRYWLGREGNIGRWARSGQIYKELEDKYERKFSQYCRSDAAFGKKLKENISALGVLGVEKRPAHNGTEYMFQPSEQQAAQCKAAYEDSLSKWARAMDDVEKTGADPNLAW